MKNSPTAAQPTSQPRRILAECLSVIADLKARIGPLAIDAPKRTIGDRKPQADGARAVEVDETTEHTRLQQTLAAAIARRDALIADIMVGEELPRRIKIYQDLVARVNGAWNDVLAYDDTMRRRFPARLSIFNTAGPHERAVVAPSTDKSPVPALPIDSRKLFAAASHATDRFVEMLASDAEAKFGRS